MKSYERLISTSPTHHTIKGVLSTGQINDLTSAAHSGCEKIKYYHFQLRKKDKKNRKKPVIVEITGFSSSEGKGFEPLRGCPQTVFKYSRLSGLHKNLLEDIVR